jgi:hypothetical protein
MRKAFKRSTRGYSTVRLCIRPCLTRRFMRKGHLMSCRSSKLRLLGRKRRSDLKKAMVRWASTY